MSPRGGKRAGAGRAPVGGSPGRVVTVRIALRLPPEAEGEMIDALKKNETITDIMRKGADDRLARAGLGSLSDLFRDGGLDLARRRRKAGIS